MTTKPTTESLIVVNENARFPRVKLVEPAPSGYVHLAAEVDKRPPFLPNGRRKRELIAECKRWCQQLEADPSVVSAVVFDALLIPPGRGEYLKRRPGKVHLARFDLAILIETTTPQAARSVETSPVHAEMERAIREAATFTHRIVATHRPVLLVVQ